MSAQEYRIYGFEFCAVKQQKDKKYRIHSFEFCAMKQPKAKISNLRF